MRDHTLNLHEYVAHVIYTMWKVPCQPPFCIFLVPRSVFMLSLLQMLAISDARHCSGALLVLGSYHALIRVSIGAVGLFLMTGPPQLQGQDTIFFISMLACSECRRLTARAGRAIINFRDYVGTFVHVPRTGRRLEWKQNHQTASHPRLQWLISRPDAA